MSDPNRGAAGMCRSMVATPTQLAGSAERESRRTRRETGSEVIGKALIPFDEDGNLIHVVSFSEMRPGLHAGPYTLEILPGPPIADDLDEEIANLLDHHATIPPASWLRRWERAKGASRDGQWKVQEDPRFRRQSR